MPADSQRAVPTIRTLAAAPDLDAIAAAGTLCRAYSPRIAANGVDASGKVSKQIAANYGPTGLSFNRRAGHECNRRRPVVDASINAEGHRASVLVDPELDTGNWRLRYKRTHTTNAQCPLEIVQGNPGLDHRSAGNAHRTDGCTHDHQGRSPLAKPVHGESPNA